MVAGTESRRNDIGCLQEWHERSCISESGAETDLISALPRAVIDLILCYLPLDEAVRTSVLSKRWRHAWKTIPDIIFDYESFPVIRNELNTWENKLKLSEAVLQVLENHTGIIQKVVIDHPNLTFVHPGIDQWVLRLSSCPVKEFALYLWSSPDCRYKMHPSLLEFKGLESLELCSCLFDHFPLTFGDGFKGLRTLKLIWTPMQQERFEYLVKSCPLLETLCYCHSESYFPTLKIEAPRLFRFQFDGVFDKLIVAHTQSLTEVVFCMEWKWSDKSREIPHGSSSTLLDFSRCLCNVKKLRIRTHFLKYLICGYIPEILPSVFPNLTSLGVDTDPKCRREFEAIMCMLKSFSRLSCLLIRFRESRVEDDDDHVENPNSFPEDKQGCLYLPEIRSFEVCRFSDRLSELNLLELLLRASPNVRYMWLVDFISSKGQCPVEETIHRLRLALPEEAMATWLHRESCKGMDPEHVHRYINGAPIWYIPPHIMESPPEPEEF